MRVHFDDQVFTSQRRGGISRYFVELIRHLNQDSALDTEVDLGWRWIRNEHALEANLGRELRIMGGGRRLVLRTANRLVSSSSGPVDVTHLTGYSRAYLARRRGHRTAVTVVDMTPELFPDLFPRGSPHSGKADVVRQADIVICISESTRRDLIDVFGPIASPIAVTPLGVGSQFKPDAARILRLAAPYLLFVGTREGYKDFGVALAAFAQLSNRRPELTLAAVGAGPFDDSERDMIRRWGLGTRVIQINASDGELPGAYAGAAAFVFPSRYEGFGLPTVEAMASGAPTVLADTSSHPEVGGDAVRYFPAGDAVGLSEQLERILDDGALRADLIAKGILRAAMFSWHRTATLTAQAYRIAEGT